MDMSIPKNNLISTSLTLVIVGSLVIGTANLIAYSIDQAVKQNQTLGVKMIPVTTNTPTPAKSALDKDVPLTEKSIPQAVVLNNKSVINTDPIVSCNFPKTGPISIPKSQCDKMIDCQLESGKYQAVWKTDCQALRNRQAQEVATLKEKIAKNEQLLNSSTTVTCVLSYGTFQLDSEYCSEVMQQDYDFKNSLSNYTPTYDLTDFTNRMNQIVQGSEVTTRQYLQDIQKQGSLPNIKLSTPTPCPKPDYYDGNRGSQGSLSQHPGCY